jgi:hypothetical protein
MEQQFGGPAVTAVTVWVLPDALQARGTSVKATSKLARASRKLQFVLLC